MDEQQERHLTPEERDEAIRLRREREDREREERREERNRQRDAEREALHQRRLGMRRIAFSAGFWGFLGASVASLIIAVIVLIFWVVVFGLAFFG